KVAGFLSSNAADGSSAGYQLMSNQVIGGLPSATAPGTTRAVNFASIAGNQYVTISSGGCYANCDNSTSPPIPNANDLQCFLSPPILNANHYQCFLNKYAAQAPYANCDGSSNPPILNANDFQCFLNKYAAGCQ